MFTRLFRSEGNSVRLLHKDNPSENITILVSKTDEERNHWMNKISKALDTVEPEENGRYRHVLQLTTFFEPTDCNKCRTRLKGIFYQGYRCLRCLSNLHKKCIYHQACLEMFE